KRLTDQIADVDCELEHLQRDVDCLQNIVRKNCLLFRNVPRHHDRESKTDLIDIVIDKCWNYLGYDLNEICVTDIARLYNRGTDRDRPILVAFKDIWVKDDIRRSWKSVRQQYRYGHFYVS